MQHPGQRHVVSEQCRPRALAAAPGEERWCRSGHSLYPPLLRSCRSSAWVSPPRQDFHHVRRYSAEARTSEMGVQAAAARAAAAATRSALTSAPSSTSAASATTSGTGATPPSTTLALPHTPSASPTKRRTPAAAMSTLPRAERLR